MEFWPEFLATSGGREFVAGGVGGMAGVLAGHPLDTLRIRLQQPPPPVSPGIVDAPSRPPSGARLLRGILRAEGPAALYRGMAAPLASVAFQVSDSVLLLQSAWIPGTSPWILSIRLPFSYRLATSIDPSLSETNKKMRHRNPWRDALTTRELAIWARHHLPSHSLKKDVAKTFTLLACRV
jgi:hypothetical protein